jgi:hypothetical protein
VAGIHVKLSAVEAAAANPTNLRARFLTVESAVANVVPIRVRFLTVEAAVGNVPNLRSRSLVVEDVSGSSLPSGNPNLRTRLMVVEALQAVLEPYMSTEVFPMSLLGLTWDVKKRPIFSNKVATHTSGKETATSYYQNPKWEYTLTYEYLPDIAKQVGDTDLHTILGFFLNRHGRFDTFLFNDPDDNTVTVGYQADFDGTVTDFNLVRAIGGFYEPVGQYNAGLAIWLDVTESFNVPATPGPYTHAVTHAAAYVSTATLTINGVAAVKVVGAPAAGQYAVTAGVYTFNAADQAKAVVVRYRYLVDPADYTYTAPNVIAFDTAPPNLATAYASFTYYFVVRFTEDTQEYNKFADKLWELQEIGLRSIPSS